MGARPAKLVLRAVATKVIVRAGCACSAPLFSHTMADDLAETDFDMTRAGVCADQRPVVTADGPVMIFGGPYSNLQATQAVLEEAERLGIASDHIICTGDLAAYCAQPEETIALIKSRQILTVMGNCDEQLAIGADDCGCGFPGDSACDRLSASWYAFARARVGGELRGWLGTFPYRVDLQIGAQRFSVVHGDCGRINAFVFATSDAREKKRQILEAGVDGVIGGHCGLPFSQDLGGVAWINAGVVGMPANDGTPRVWYCVLTPRPSGSVEIAHRALSYDHTGAGAAMAEAGLPTDYRHGLISGLWPSLDVLPEVERSVSGQPLQPFRWTFDARGKKRAKAVAWPNMAQMRKDALADAAAA